MRMFKCKICGDETPRWNRCEKCYKCDICGTKEGLCSYIRGVFCKACHKIKAQKDIDGFQKLEKDTDCEDEITCPWCGYVFTDSWEFSDEGEHNCGECEHDFYYNREVLVSYSTVKEL